MCRLETAHGPQNGNGNINIVRKLQLLGSGLTMYIKHVVTTPTHYTPGNRLIDLA